MMGFIQTAYVEFANGHRNPLQPVPISGGPAWIRSDRYRVNAKAEDNPRMEMMSGAMTSGASRRPV
jgi:hypothetical protein